MNCPTCAAPAITKHIGKPIFACINRHEWTTGGWRLSRRGLWLKAE